MAQVGSICLVSLRKDLGLFPSVYNYVYLLNIYLYVHNHMLIYLYIILNIH